MKTYKEINVNTMIGSICADETKEENLQRLLLMKKKG